MGRAPTRAKPLRPQGTSLILEDTMSRAPRPHRNGKSPKRPARDSALKSSHQDSPNAEARSRVEQSGRNPIPVQAEWLEPDGEPQATVSTPRTEALAGRGSPRGSRARPIRAAPPPLPADISEASQLALQRAEAIHPARDNEGLVRRIGKNSENGHQRGLREGDGLPGERCAFALRGRFLRIRWGQPPG